MDNDIYYWICHCNIILHARFNNHGTTCDKLCHSKFQLRMLIKMYDQIKSLPIKTKFEMIILFIIVIGCFIILHYLYVTS